MMVGFFDVAVPTSMDKQRFFIRPKSSGAPRGAAPVRECGSATPKDP